jgi:hypothetical protein
LFLDEANTMIGVDIVDLFVDANSGTTRTTTDFYNLLTDDLTALSDEQNRRSSTLSLSVTDVGTGNDSIDG